MREKSKYPKVALNIRIRKEQLEEIDKIADRKEIERSELIRKIIENFIRTYKTGL